MQKSQEINQISQRNPLKRDNLKVALVHDFLVNFGGAERVLEVFCEMFPDAPIYTLLYDKDKMSAGGGSALGGDDRFKGHEIRTSFLQNFPKFLRRRFKWLLPLIPTAPETFDLREFDLVISSSGAWSKGIVTRLDTTHIAYIHSPMRFVWDYNEKYLREERKEKLGFLVRPLLSYFRLWDKLAADRPDYLIANSRYTAARIRKYYGRESKVIYPAVLTNYESSTNVRITNNVKKYFLIVSRLSAYKKIDKAIEAFNKLGLPLWIVGTGKQEKYLKSITKENVKFLGFVPDDELSEIYKNARAVVFPGVDDFGLAPAEAMSHGIPVVAINQGGAKEIVEEGKTGEFFTASTSEVIADGIRRFMENEKSYDRNYIKQSTERFSKKRFEREMEEYIIKLF